MQGLNFDSIVTLTTAAPDGVRRVVMIGTLRMAAAAVLDMPPAEARTARIMADGLPLGGIWLPPFGVVPRAEAGHLPRAASLPVASVLMGG